MSTTQETSTETVDDTATEVKEAKETARRAQETARRAQETAQALHAKLLELQTNALEQFRKTGMEFSEKLHLFFEELGQTEAEPTEEVADKQ